MFILQAKKEVENTNIVRTSENVMIALENNILREKINMMEEEKNKLVLAKDVSDSKIADLNITNHKLNYNNEALESSIIALKSEKENVEER